MGAESFLLAKLLTNKHLESSVTDIRHTGYKVYSQFDDDGIIQFLVNKLKIQNKIFIEFGVENYIESNTRFLLENDNWSGLVMDGSSKYIQQIKNAPDYWKYDLIAHEAFITSENINDLIFTQGLEGKIGLLHIDIDGNDYWVWKAISVVTPDIAIIEYNSVFGKERAITIPYNPKFQRGKAHYSNLYAGASLLSLIDLGREKGYIFIGSNSSGNNAFFIKKEFEDLIPEVDIENGYVNSKFRESRDKKGKLTHLRGKERIKFLKTQGLKVYNTRSNAIEDL